MIWRELQKCDHELVDGEGNMGLKEGPGPSWGGDDAKLGPNKQKRGEEVSIPDRGNSPVMQEMKRSLCI